jgi:hypothetical protein
MSPDDGMFAVAVTVKNKKEATPFIAHIARKMNWDEEQRELGLTKRQWAKLMLCEAPDANHTVNVAAIAGYVRIDRLKLKEFLIRAWRSYE